MKILDETRALRIARDAERAGHDLSDHSRDVLAVFVVRHSIGRLGILDDEVDHLAWRFQKPVTGAADRQPEFFFDGGEEFVERPAHVDDPIKNERMLNLNVAAALRSGNVCDAPVADAT